MAFVRLPLRHVPAVKSSIQPCNSLLASQAAEPTRSSKNNTIGNVKRACKTG